MRVRDVSYTKNHLSVIIEVFRPLLKKGKVILMSENGTKRIRRTPEERIAEIDAKIGAVNQSIEELEAKKHAAAASFDEKIAAAQERIKGLEAKKQEILSPKPPRKPRKTKKQKIQEILKEAQKSGMKPEEIAERLGVSLSE